MKTLIMRRHQLPDCSTGVIVTPSRIFTTIEKPWVAQDGMRGGVPFLSCVPYGKYKLILFQSSRHGETWALENAELGVYVHKDKRELSTDRYACLLHRANWVNQVVGCVGVGSGVSYSDSGYMITRSALAMNELSELIDNYNYMEILPYEI